MNLFSPSEIKILLQKHGARASKGLGQNFLIDKKVLQKIIDASNIGERDTILEIGPGIGTLTSELAKYARKIIAVEKDKKMLEILSETLACHKNIEIINADILKFNSLKFNNYKIVANIPYYLTSPLIRKFLESENPPSEMVLMLQREVAQRICAKPPKMNLLAVSVQFYAEPKIISYVSKNCFWPTPKIDSAIIKISNIKIQESKLDSEKFFKIVKTGFSHPRKQLVNNLATLKLQNDVKLSKENVFKWLLDNNLKPSQRPETLSISDWLKLVNNFEKNG